VVNYNMNGGIFTATAHFGTVGENVKEVERLGKMAMYCQ